MTKTTLSSESKAFHRHVKRYVQAQVHRFAAVTPPELSALCRDELLGLGVSGVEISEAGVEFSGKLADCYKANLWLRTASRILCRLSEFRAGIAEELFYKVSVMRWELWLNPGIPLQVEAHVERSRIQHEGQVAETVVSAIQRHFGAQGATPPVRREAGSGSEEADSVPSSPKQRLIVRLRENHCEISLDTTGAHLHRRGYRVRHGGAPLRETLAAAILMKCGWRPETPLLDGMCGAGTAPIEAALMARRLPPGLNRRFLFELWPSFEEATWGYLRRRARDLALECSPAPITGLDLDPEVLEFARQNAERAEVAGDLHWEAADFFHFDPSQRGPAPGLLFLNPPYGKRLEDGGLDLYARLGAHLRQYFKGWRVAVLAPSRPLAMQIKPASARFWTITHGGIPVVVLMGQI